MTTLFLCISDVKLAQNDMERLKASSVPQYFTYECWSNIIKGQVFLQYMACRTSYFWGLLPYDPRLIMSLFRYWTVLINIGFPLPVNLVKVYNSMRTSDVPSNTKESIVTLSNYLARTMYLVYTPDVQQQTDGSSCGLFALAFAHTLCEGSDPSRMTFLRLSLFPFFELSWKEEHYIIWEWTKPIREVLIQGLLLV